MRSTRLARYRKRNQKLMILSKVFTICYALIFSVSLLTSDTEAYFSQNNSVDATISTAEDWWDQSNLMFIGKDSEVIHICPPTEIAVEIKNTGQSMTKETTYEVLYSVNTKRQIKVEKKLRQVRFLYLTKMSLQY
ncbi:amyloid fiber anchoring/assembly protein TapA [Paracerasibacillus soli]|uniref:Amyloid fiber anchoring/assembly protein TapA n=1 Tax=Paracerasibacillus soli TaxID=480284 RepID=A0ABU5CRF6_9BACI|nr:amyloid fiber anchoring/assembly protein TapA [Virgibacillus soli]MDY0408943.1 amyloid fiber anchoring/assembly protein TapA [Virgibacillus soli]